MITRRQFGRAAFGTLAASHLATPTLAQAKPKVVVIGGGPGGATVARYTNTCWSLIAPDDTVKVGGRYEAKDGKIAAIETFVSKTGETAELRKQTQEENIGWYTGITADIFG